MKRFVSICLIAFCTVTTIFAYDRAPFDWNISASAVSYGSGDVTRAVKAVTSGTYTHLVLSGAVGSSLKLDENLFATVSCTPVADLYTSDTGEAVFLDWCGNAGLRLYPGLGGLNVGVEYSIGIRQDIIRTKNATPDTGFTPWGNGFRFISEYDFASQIEGFGPIVGITWRHMPRGNKTSDNIFSLYLSFQKN